MNCKCCGQLLSYTRNSRDMLTEYCDAICYAAHQTLNRNALQFWRQGAVALRMPSSLARWAGREAV